MRTRSEALAVSSDVASVAPPGPWICQRNGVLGPSLFHVFSWSASMNLTCIVERERDMWAELTDTRWACYRNPALDHLIVSINQRVWFGPNILHILELNPF